MTTQAERDAFELDGFRTEAAVQFGFETINDDANEYKCDEAALLAFAKACERKGMAEARELMRAAEADVHGVPREIDEIISKIDVELTPIRDAVEAKFMTAQGYVRATDSQPGARWIKP